MATERTVLVRLKAEVGDYVRGMTEAAAVTRGLFSEMNTANDRTTWLAQGLLAVTPALAPIGAVVIPAVATLATQFGLAAAAAGVGIIAFQGVGGALKALNDYQLKPTAANLLKMQQAMAAIGPDGAHFVRFLDSLHGQLSGLQMTARAGIFPGFEQGIKSMLTRLPEVNSIIGKIAGAMGDLASKAGAGLGGPKFDSFFKFLDREARPLLEEMGATIGNFVQGLAAMVVAFEPLTVTFSHGFLEMSRAFSTWAQGLLTSGSFTDFIAYAQESLPKVVDLISSLASIFVDLARAAAPVGSVMLPILTHLLDLIGNIANTPLASAFLGLAAAMSLWGRAVALSKITTGEMVGTLGKLEGGVVATTRAAWAGRPAMDAFGLSVARASGLVGNTSGKVSEATGAVRGFARGMAPAAGAIGLLAFSMSGLADSMGLSNTASLGLMGTFAGPWGTAAGVAAGAVMDLVHSNDALDTSVATVNRAILSGSVPAMKQLETQIQSSLAAFNQQTDSKGGFADFLSSMGHLPKNLFALFSGSVDQAGAALSRLQSAIETAKRGSRGLPQILGGDLLRGIGLTGAGFRSAAMDATQFGQAVERVNGILTGRASLRDYQQALDDFSKAVKKNGKTLDITTQKGRDVQAALDNIAGTALKAAQSLSGLKQTRYLDQARKDFIGAAMDLGKTKTQAQQLADRLGLLDRIKSQPKVQLQGMQALNRNLDELNQHFNVIDHLMGGPTVKLTGADGVNAALGNLLTRLGLVNGYTATAHVTTVYSHRGSPGAVTPAAGGHITGPGTSTSDSIPAMLSNGEYVIKAAAVDRYGVDFLHQLNAMRLAAGGIVRRDAVPMFATGALAPVVNVSGSSRDELKMFADLIGDRVAKAVRSNGQAAYAGRRV